jgi:hypothetical protein
VRRAAHHLGAAAPGVDDEVGRRAGAQHAVPGPAPAAVRARSSPCRPAARRGRRAARPWPPA